MTWEIVVQAVISGLLMGLVYALIAAGLSLIFGLMEIVNFAHGEFMMISMYAAFWLWALFGLDPLYSVPLCAALLFFMGVATHYGIIRHILGASMLAQICATFGLAVFLRALAQFLWTPDFRSIANPMVEGRVEIGGVFLGQPQIIASFGCLLAFGFLYFFWGMGAACVGLAGVFLSTFYYVFPEVGLEFALLAYVAVAMGGFGSILGSLVAGILIGLVESLGGLLIDPSIVVFRPKGLFGRF
jgi:branched-chain amino acid transport system permease protein